MNLLYVSVAYPPSIGGGEIHLHQLARTLVGAGHAARAVAQWSRPRSDWLRGATHGADDGREYVQDGIPVAQLGFGRVRKLRMRPWAALYRQRLARGLAIQRITRLIEPPFDGAVRSRPDVVHALRQGCEFLASAALAFSRRAGCPFVITSLHHPGWHGGKYRHYDRLFRAADRVIALTEHERRTLVERKGVDPSRVDVTGVGPVLHPTPDVELFRERHGVRRPYVLFVGRKAPHKGWQQLLAAAPSVLRRHADVEFVFVGRDGEASAAAFEAQADPRIRNLGAVDLHTKTSAIAGCELLCLPSALESFGGVFTEAWAFGKPVIGCEIPAVRELIDDGVDGLLCGRAPDQLAERLAYLLDHPGRAAAMGRAGRAKVERRFTWPKLAAATLRIYESAAGARSSSM